MKNILLLGLLTLGVMSCAKPEKIQERVDKRLGDDTFTITYYDGIHTTSTNPEVYYITFHEGSNTTSLRYTNFMGDSSEGSNSPWYILEMDDNRNGRFIFPDEIDKRTSCLIDATIHINVGGRVELRSYFNGEEKLWTKN